MIWVKANPGRVAYSAPSGGSLIPSDRYMPVHNSPWIEKRARDGDIDVKEQDPDAARAPVEKPRSSKTTS